MKDKKDKHKDEKHHDDKKDDKHCVPCIAANTLIKTSRGEIMIQDLRVGDKVITIDNGYKEILYITEGFTDQCYQYVGKIGSVILSKNHCILYSVALQSEYVIPVKFYQMIDATCKTVNEWTRVFNILLESHELINANDCWVESMYPGQWIIDNMDDREDAEIIAKFASENLYSRCREMLTKKKAEEISLHW